VAVPPPAAGAGRPPLRGTAVSRDGADRSGAGAARGAGGRGSDPPRSRAIGSRGSRFGAAPGCGERERPAPSYGSYDRVG